MADFLDRLGDELSRAVRTPIDTAAAGGAAPRRSRLRAMIGRRPAGVARPSLSSRSTVGALAALAAIVIAAVVVIAGKPFAPGPHGVSSSEASGSAVAPLSGLGRAGGSATQKSQSQAHRGSGSAVHNGPSMSKAGSAAEAEGMVSPPSIRAQPLSRGQRNRRAARRRARSLLAKLSLPADARRVNADPSTSGALASAPSPSSPRLVDLHRYWRLRRSPQKTIEWVADHPPPGSHLRGQGRGAPVLARWTFAYPASSGRLRTVWLVVQVAAAAHGGTAIRADGEAVWAGPRAAG